MPAYAPQPDESGSLVLRFGTAVGLAVAASLACALPAAMRVSALVEGTSRMRVWLGLAAVALGPMVTAVMVLRAAREGLRAFGGPPGGLRAFGLALWLVSLVVMLSLFGAVLRATTHQHALAAVTFACVAATLAAGSGLVCGRMVAILRSLPVGARRLVALGLAAPAIAALAWIGLRVAREAPHDAGSSAATGTVVDVLAFLLAALLASRPSLSMRRALAVVGPPVAVAVIAVGIATLREAQVRDAVGERAPAYAPAADLLSGR